MQMYFYKFTINVTSSSLFREIYRLLHMRVNLLYHVSKKYLLLRLFRLLKYSLI